MHSPACVLSHLSLNSSLLIREFQPWDILKAGRASCVVWRITGLPATCIPRVSPPASRKLTVVTSTPFRQFPDSHFAQALPAIMSLSRCSNSTRSSPCTLQAPPYPLYDAWAYYAYSSSHDKLDAIRMHFLTLNSHDDPIARYAPQDYDRNEWFTLRHHPRRWTLGLVPARWGSESLGQAPRARVVQGNGRGYTVGAQKSKVD